jgi:hypothetical protein
MPSDANQTVITMTDRARLYECNVGSNGQSFNGVLVLHRGQHGGIYNGDIKNRGIDRRNAGYGLVVVSGEGVILINVGFYVNRMALTSAARTTSSATCAGTRTTATSFRQGGPGGLRLVQRRRPLRLRVEVGQRRRVALLDADHHHRDRRGRQQPNRRPRRRREQRRLHRCEVTPQ